MDSKIKWSISVLLLIIAITCYTTQSAATQSGFQLYAQARISSEVKKDSPVIFLEAEARVMEIEMKGRMTTPTGEKKSFTLKDNGVGMDGDEIKGDGIYAAALTNLETDGTYQFVIEAYKEKKVCSRYTLSVNITH